MKWISITGLLVALGLELAASQAMAQPGTIGQSFDDLSARVEQRDQQIRELQAQVNAVQAQQQQQGTPATPAAYAPGDPAAAPGTVYSGSAAQAAQGYEVGSDMSVKAGFRNGTGLYLETPNKDFTMHFGFQAQWDNVAWRQNSLNTISSSSGGIGPLDDGDYWRRIRPTVDGTFFENYEYRISLALENDQFSTVGLAENWVGINNIPVIGTIRAGRVRDPIGLESDMASKSQCPTFMERSTYATAIELNQSYVGGLWFCNTAYDDRLFWSGAVFRPDIASSVNAGDLFGTGTWGWQGRMTGLPLYEDEGRELLHLGLSGGWRDGTNAVAGAGAGAPKVVSLAAGSEMADDDPAKSPTSIAGGTAQYLPEANNKKLVQTGNIYCSQEFLLGTEMLYIRGPWSLQAEYGWNICDNAFLRTTSGSSGGPGTTPTGPKECYVFSGGYLQASYILTGENRAYDKKSGTLARNYLGGEGPYENAFIVRDADGHICSGWGAWEVACRYSYLDLNSRVGASGGPFDQVQGGIEQGVSLGLNWYINTNLSVMTDWTYNYRSDAAALTFTSTTAGAWHPYQNGSTNGVGTELQFVF
jgi:phosphate-selective porin OprO/OprP